MKDAFIEDFLKKVRECIENKKFNFQKRTKNMNFLAKSGITEKEVKEIILSLTINEYYKGPDREKDNFFKKGDIWIFKKNYLTNEIYIKLKLFKIDNTFYLKCLSFHD